ncbi:transmembrane protein 82-like [Cyprinodon tularosa]|uniref:transmembrane protein 82-like n=1 Tax=Cyprinodon variegatus TaxID=28743 RepID=UPI000742CBFC|nr:PREDICTED: transmembrane protein 82-like [Cyprinodon variegatus]XP_038135763.1 transmembrane protein 82-like [Cyprinodon tularosa]
MNIFFPFFWILEVFEWSPFDSNPIDCFLKGLIGACGVSVFYNLMRVYNFIQACSDSETQSGSKQRSSSSTNPLRRKWKAALQFWFLTGVLSLVGSRVSSLIVLEFSLRVVSALTLAGADDDSRGLELLLIQSQFSLGCGLTCTLAFIHQGAPHSSFGLLLAAALSWVLASYSSSLWSHVARLFPQHRTDCYCGKCISLLTSGHTMMASLQRAVILAFATAAVASTTTVYEHFLSQKDAMKFWTPLTLCYTMLVAYNQEEQKRMTVTETLLRTVVLRLGGLLVLMLAVGYWSDVLHVLIAFLGEGVCLLPAQDLLQAAVKEEQESSKLQTEVRPHLKEEKKSR